MPFGKKRFVSEWMPVSALRPVAEDISDFGYSKQYAEANHLNETKDARWSRGVPDERVCFFEDLEVKEKGGTVLWRENDGFRRECAPKRFQTQFGVFRNHNDGEFMSWMEPIGEDHVEENLHGLVDSHFMSESAIQGNFCDMFDCGPYAFAVSNLMHMCSGSFSIIRIGEDLKPVTMFDNENPPGSSCLEYAGRYRDGDGFILIASGYIFADEQIRNGNIEKKTYLFRIGSDGNCSVLKEWDIMIPSPNSMAAAEDHIWFGQNKMVTRLNPETGGMRFYTNKTDEDLADLKKQEE